MGTSPGPNPYYVHHYYTNKATYEKELSLYGSYDLLVKGLISIRNRFASLVLPVSVTKHSGDLSLGSAFVYNSKVIFTARHCIEGLSKVAVLYKDKPIKISQVHFPANDWLDIAILEIEENDFNDYPTIALLQREDWQGVGEMDELNFINESSITVFAPPKILGDVLTLGYPPISGFESILIADKSSINSTYLRTSAGEVLAFEKKYRDSLEYLLINAKVKGGNSGGPIFDKLGRVVGMVVEMPTEIENQEQLDSLGYGLALPAKYLKATLDGIRSNDDSVVKHTIKHLENNCFALIN